MRIGGEISGLDIFDFRLDLELNWLLELIAIVLALV